MLREARRRVTRLLPWAVKQRVLRMTFGPEVIPTHPISENAQWILRALERTARSDRPRRTA